MVCVCVCVSARRRPVKLVPREKKHFIILYYIMISVSMLCSITLFGSILITSCTILVHTLFYLVGASKAPAILGPLREDAVFGNLPGFAIRHPRVGRLSAHAPDLLFVLWLLLLLLLVLLLLLLLLLLLW